MRLIGIVLTVISFIVFCFGLKEFFSRKQRTTKKLLVLTVSVIIAILLLEVCSRITSSETGLSTLLINIMQVFSLDADYSRAMNPDALFSSDRLNSLVKVYRIVIYTLAPVIGGALLYDVLAGISPELKLMFVKNRKQYVFSQLNEKSLTLAKSITEHPEWFPKPVIVFTDCNREDEKAQELLSEAKLIKAICLEDGLTNNTTIQNAADSSIFLIRDEDGGDFDDTRNLNELQQVLSAEYNNSITERSIFIFTNHADTVENIRVVKRSRDKENGDELASKIKLHVIRDYAHAANNLLSHHSPLKTLNYEDREPLRFLIVGNTLFSKEIFKTIFSQCQILDHPLEIAVAYSSEKEEEKTEFEIYLNSLNSEILESCSEKSEVLRQYCNSDVFSEPYARLAFIEEDLTGMNPKDLLTENRVFKYGSNNSFQLKDFNYFIVAGDDDAFNIELADRLRRELKYLSLNRENRKQVIATYIKDSSFSDVQTMRENEWNSANKNLEMVHFGSIEDRFSVTGVFTDKAIVLLDNYQDQDRKHYLPAFDATKDDIYNEWSNISREYHLPSKMFSAGCWEENESVEASLKNKLKYCEAIENNKELFDALTWLEHRRWNAFIRMQGFRQPENLNTVLEAVEVSNGNWNSIKERLSSFINFKEKGVGHLELDERLGIIDKLQSAVNSINNETLQKGIDDLREAVIRKNEAAALVPYEHKDVQIRLHSCLVESDKNENPQQKKDMLSLIDDLRNLVAGINKTDYSPLVDSLEERVKINGHSELLKYVDDIRKAVVKKEEPKKKKNRPEVYRHKQPAHTNPRPCVIKDYDCPDGYNYPDLSMQETYLYLKKELPQAEDFKKQWDKLLKTDNLKTELAKCANLDHVNRYYADLVRDNIK